MPSLYRDYRPKSFSEVINQDAIKITLRNAIDSGSFTHSYLFTGPRGTGKTSVARIFARAINCLHPVKGEPCNKCDICKQFLDGTSLDLIEIDAASNTGIENIREIIEHLKFSPTQAKYKVFIIDEVHMLSKGAFNALLKTLEEPPAHAVFILATTEIHKVPATVVSRTQRFDFKKINAAELLEHLASIAKKEKISLDKESLKLIVNSAEGSARDALSILDRLSSFGDADLAEVEKLLGITNVSAAQKLLDFLIVKDAAGALNFLEEMFSSGIDPAQFNKDFLEYLRKILMHSSGARFDFALDQTQLEKLSEQASKLSSAQLLNIIRLFLKANKDFQIAPSLELPLEIAAAESCLAPGSGVNSSVSAAAHPGVAKGVPAVPKQVSKPAPSRTVKAEVAEMEMEELETEDSPASAPETTPEKLISRDEVLKAWPLLLTSLKALHSLLLATMKTAKVKSVENNVLILACEYKLHQDNILTAKNKEVFLKLLHDHFGTDFRLKVVLEKPDKPVEKDSSSLAIDVFGGELI